MNKIGKFLRKLDRKRRIDVEVVIAQILEDRLDGLDVKKLKGRKEEYRVRVGTVRILFMRTASGNVILGTGFRADDTY